VPSPSRGLSLALSLPLSSFPDPVLLPSFPFLGLVSTSSSFALSDQISASDNRPQRPATQLLLMCHTSSIKTITELPIFNDLESRFSLLGAEHLNKEKGEGKDGFKWMKDPDAKPVSRSRNNAKEDDVETKPKNGKDGNNTGSGNDDKGKDKAKDSPREGDGTTLKEDDESPVGSPTSSPKPGKKKEEEDDKSAGMWDVKF